MTEREAYELREMAHDLRRSWERTTPGRWVSGQNKVGWNYSLHADQDVVVAAAMTRRDAEFVELVHGLMPRLLRALEAPP